MPWGMGHIGLKRAFWKIPPPLTAELNPQPMEELKKVRKADAYGYGKEKEEGQRQERKAA